MKRTVLFTSVVGAFFVIFYFSSCGSPSCEEQKQEKVEAYTQIYNDRKALCQDAECRSNAWGMMAIGITLAHADYECCLDPNSCYTKQT